MSVRVTDAIGQRFIPRRWQRIVSLVQSLTETLFSYGAGDAVVGATRYCVEPVAALARLPKVGGTKNPKLAIIRGLRPDLVIASVEENRKEDVEALIAEGLAVYVTLPTSVAGAIATLADLARLVRAEEAAQPMLAEMREALDAAEAESAGAAPLPYFCPIWRRPYMTSGPGTYMHDLLRVCGGVSVCGAGEARYFEIGLDQVAASRPQLVLLPDEPYPFAERHKADFGAYPEMPAVAAGAIHCIDGKLLTWYGPRTADGLRTIRSLVARAARRDP